MRNAGLDEAQAGFRIARRNINNLKYADDTTLMAESKEELKSLLMKVKEESEEAGLKLNFQKMKIMASIFHHFMANRWVKMETLFGGAPKSLQMVSAAMKLKGPCKGPYAKIKAMIFPVVMYGCKSWTMSNLSTKVLILSNCDAGEDSWKSLGLQGDQTSQS